MHHYRKLTKVDTDNITDIQYGYICVNCNENVRCIGNPNTLKNGKYNDQCSKCNVTKKILVSGVLGFIFSNFIKTMVPLYPQYRFVGVDVAFNKFNLLNKFERPNYKFYFGDISDEHAMDTIFDIEKPDFVINGAACSFVQYSIDKATSFISSNLAGTQTMLDMSVKYGVEKFIQISTDEVLGHLKSDDAPWTELAPLAPRNPYSATKAGAELLVKAAIETHNLPGIISRCSNNYGPAQQKVNLVPVCINSILNDRPIPISGTGLNIREWVYVGDHNNAIMTLLEKGLPGEIYNIGSSIELTNLEMVERIGKMLGKTPKIKFVENRKGHDWRYALNCDKIKQLGWEPLVSFDQGMRTTIDWYIANQYRYKS